MQARIVLFVTIFLISSILILADEGFAVRSPREWHQEGHKHSLRFRDVKSSSSFSYEGSKGPAHWGSLNDDWKTCSSGEKQSPISLTEQQNVPNNKNDLELHWDDLDAPNVFINNGHTWEIDCEGRGNWVRYNGKRYDLLQFHFHSPSEHHIRGKVYQMEAHFVHQNEASGNLLVVGVFFETEGDNDQNNFLSQFWSYFFDEEGEKSKNVDIAFTDFVSELDLSDYWSYTGSLTTPPCTEGVTFVVLKAPQKLTPEEVRKLNNAVRFNSRFTQDVNGREAL